MAINRRIPLSHEPNPASRLFKFAGDDLTYRRALECLTAAIYYEAANESEDGQRAVAQVVLNRVRHPVFPDSVCAVVYQGSTRRTGCQFTFTCDGSLRRQPVASKWARARKVAEAALDGFVFKAVGHATHYHANYVVPYWATILSKKAIVGAHIFYRWPGWLGRPAAFTKAYARTELDPLALREAALRARDTEAPSLAFTFATDPRVELVSIVQLLAARAPVSERTSAYARDVRRRFARFSEHMAVQIYRQLPSNRTGSSIDVSIQVLMHFSPPPQLRPVQPLRPELLTAIGGSDRLAWFISAVRDFARHSRFENFYRERQPFYAAVVERFSDHGAATAAPTEALDPLSQRPRVILAPLLENSTASSCQLAVKHGSPPWIVIPASAAPKLTRAAFHRAADDLLDCAKLKSALKSDSSNVPGQPSSLAR